MSKTRGVPCPNCASRHTEVKGGEVCDAGYKRYRKCGECDMSFSTFELTQETLNRKTAMIVRGIGELRAYLDSFSEKIQQ